MSALPYLTADQIRARLDPLQAVEAISAALRSGFDPADDLSRTRTPVANGEFLLMPSTSNQASGIKVLSIAPANPSQGRPLIQGLYILFDHSSLRPVALLDGAALTERRTPAVTLAGLQPILLRTTAPCRLVVIGSGPQALAHIAMAAAVLAGRRPLLSIRLLVRKPQRVDPSGLAELVPAAGAAKPVVLALDSPAGRAALAEADCVICATTAATPLFEATALSSHAVVAAIGSHHPDRRELDATLMGRAQVIVEDPATALREAGDVVLAVAEGQLRPDDLIPLSQVVNRTVDLTADRPVVFKSTGMSWEDLVIAAAVVNTPA